MTVRGFSFLSSSDLQDSEEGADDGDGWSQKEVATEKRRKWNNETERSWTDSETPAAFSHHASGQVELVCGGNETEHEIYSAGVTSLIIMKRKHAVISSILSSVDECGPISGQKETTGRLLLK